MAPALGLLGPRGLEVVCARVDRSLVPVFIENTSPNLLDGTSFVACSRTFPWMNIDYYQNRAPHHLVPAFVDLDFKL